MSRPTTFNDLCDAYEAATGMRVGGATADRLYDALRGRDENGEFYLSDADWDKLPAAVRNLLDPGSDESAITGWEVELVRPSDEYTDSDDVEDEHVEEDMFRGDR